MFFVNIFSESFVNKQFYKTNEFTERTYNLKTNKKKENEKRFSCRKYSNFTKQQKNTNNKRVAECAHLYFGLSWWRSWRCLAAPVQVVPIISAPWQTSRPSPAAIYSLLFFKRRFTRNYHIKTKKGNRFWLKSLKKYKVNKCLFSV